MKSHNLRHTAGWLLLAGSLLLISSGANAAEWSAEDELMRKDVVAMKQNMEDISDRLNAMERLLYQLLEGQKALSQQMTTENGQMRKWVYNN